MEMRLASAQNLSTATLRENANVFVESFDTPWKLPSLVRDLPAGVKEQHRLHLTASAATELVPPQVEFVVHWRDDRARMHEVLLKRRVPVVPHAELAETRAVKGGTFVWDLRGDEPLKHSPTWEMTWKGENLYMRVHVDDAVQCYAESKALDWKWGGLAGDAVSVAWAAGPKSNAESVQRIWVLPFGANGPELWKNSGVGEKQTALVRQENAEIKAEVQTQKEGYSVMLILPRKMVMRDEKRGETSCVMNIAVSDNDGGLQTWVRSWAKEELGPPGWGRVALRIPETQPAPPQATPR
ncbi:MAG: hypothetical protein FWD61_02520 [Phycisphaerales bacterium]|nr:hypothetical protein [Phycisphaerales bacterium]